ncbi:hypothetical protein ZIOFF_062833 [Zingiber officinale]|uniref:60S acidic ribosomal protein P2 n=1 Tax=Zingiber officinale TaxID=94328 RepID=A0A8J5F2K6_ZINOF|nr:hypothetical protein ZIOFF_062833 [Zingiber officinale]
MKIVAAYLLVVLGGNPNPSADDIRSILESVGAEAEDKRINHFLAEVKGKDITEVIAAGREKFASVPSGGSVAAIGVAAPGSGGAGGAPAAEEPKKEEKVEEKEESDEVKLPVFPSRKFSFGIFNPAVVARKGVATLSSSKNLTATRTVSIQKPSVLKEKSKLSSGQPSKNAKNVTNVAAKNITSIGIAQENQAIKRQKLDDGRSKQIHNLKNRVLLHKSRLGLASAPDVHSSGAKVGQGEKPLQQGMELYPRIGKNFDIKVFTNCRFGMMSWAVLAVTYCIKQFYLMAEPLEVPFLVGSVARVAHDALVGTVLEYAGSQPP